MRFQEQFGRLQLREPWRFDVQYMDIQQPATLALVLKSLMGEAWFLGRQLEELLQAQV
jgi:hypothetical protein